MKQIEPHNHWIFEQREAERDRAIEKQETSEQLLFERLSEILTKGNASTWEEIIHAAESLAVNANQASTTQNKQKTD